MSLEHPQSSFKPERLSEPGKRALLNLLAGRSSDDGLHGRSAFGGHVATIRSLRRMGLVTTHHEAGIALSDAGRVEAERIAGSGPTTSV